LYNKFYKIINECLKIYQETILKKNKFISKAVENIREKYKSKFDIYTGFSKPLIIVRKSSYQYIKIDMSDENLLYSTNIKFIKKYIEDKIKLFDMELLIDFKGIKKIINNINDNYKNIFNNNFIYNKDFYNNEISFYISGNYPNNFYKSYSILNNNLYYENGLEDGLHTLSLIKNIKSINEFKVILLEDICNEIFKNKSSISLNCIDCNNDFCFTKEEMIYYNINNLYFPRRCKSCRDKRKKNKGGLIFEQS